MLQLLTYASVPHRFCLHFVCAEQQAPSLDRLVHLYCMNCVLLNGNFCKICMVKLFAFASAR